MKERELPLRHHLEELRKRLIIAVVATVVTTIVAFVLYKEIIRFLLIPADDLGAGGGEATLVFVEVTEMLAVSLKVSVISGLVLAFPIILSQIIMFVAPGLTLREKRYLYAAMPAVLLAFVAGAAFGYFVLIPPAMNFLLNWGSDIATPMIRIGNYVNVILMLLFWMGVVFETPVVMFILGEAGDSLLERVCSVEAAMGRGILYPGGLDNPHIRHCKPVHGCGAVDPSLRGRDPGWPDWRPVEDPKRIRGSPHRAPEGTTKEL